MNELKLNLQIVGTFLDNVEEMLKENTPDKSLLCSARKDLNEWYEKNKKRDSSLCPECSGEGLLFDAAADPYGHTCKSCNGTGGVKCA